MAVDSNDSYPASFVDTLVQDRIGTLQDSQFQQRAL